MLYRALAVNFFLKNGSVLSTLVLTFILAVDLDVSQFAVYSLAIPLVPVVGQVACFSCGRMITKYVALSHNDEPARSAVNEYISLCLISGTLLIAVSLVFLILDLFLFSAITMLCFLWASINIFSEYLRGLFQNFSSALIQYFPPIALLVIYILLKALGVYLDLDGILYLSVLCSSLSCLIFIPLVRINAPINFVFKLDKALATIGDLLPLILVSTFSALIPFIDLYVVGLFMDDIDVSRYALAQRICWGLSLLLVVANSITGAKLSLLINENDVGEVSKFAQKVAKICTSSAILFGLVIVLWYSPMFHLIFGDRFADNFDMDKSVLLVLVLGQIVNCFFGSCGLILILMGRQRDLLAIVVFSFFVGALLSTLAAQYIGLLGAAIGAAVALIVQNVYASRLLSRRYGIKTGFLQ